MIRQKNWRRWKVFPFKLVSNLMMNYFRLILILLSLGVLSACSTLTTEPKVTEQPSKSDGDEGQVTEEANPANSLLAFEGKDPMADIQINPEIKKSYSQVAQLNQSKKYSQALTVLDKIKSQYPQLSGPDYQRARIFLQQQQLDKALEAIDLSLKNNQRNYYSLNLKGIILREQGKFTEAKQVYLKAIEIYPPYPNSHLNLGVLADIYLRDSALALIKYQQYQALTNGTDKKVTNWIIEIERRIKAGG